MQVLFFLILKEFCRNMWGIFLKPGIASFCPYFLHGRSIRKTVVKENIKLKNKGKHLRFYVNCAKITLGICAIFVYTVAYGEEKIC